MKDARGHGSNNHGGSAFVTSAGKGIMPSKPYRQSDPALRHTDTGRTVFGLRQRLAQADSPGHARVLLQSIRNLVGRS